ncbi:MAG: hypothetical protein H6832_13850 [Planctomycetes bacterium]|nr:hypothetical protein [Planctomycetota bacterium]MCB9891261.1 hypothetical protein [Planctomycetota bacterium]MCB9919480.1 hypothetical protein [Planctomycetota bacterium]
MSLRFAARHLALLVAACVLAGASARALPLQDEKEEAGKSRLERPLMPVPVYPLRHRGSIEISVDGSLHEWPAGLPAIELSDIRQLSGTAFGAMRGESDFSARGAGLWDEETLYLFFLVRDDWGRPFDTRLNLPDRMVVPPADALTLFFDPKRDTRSYGPYEGRADDREFWVGMTDGGGTLVVAWQRFKALASRPDKTRARMLYDSKKHVFTIEMAIPWREISPDFEAKDGAAIDTQIILDDFDAPTDTLPQTRIGWTFGSSPVLDPAIYGTFVLVKNDWQAKFRPEAPEYPPAKHPRLPDDTFWISLQKDLAAIQARSGREGITGRRYDLLRALDDRLALYPVLDAQECYKLLQREMPRELSGYLRNGPFYFQDLVMRELLRDLEGDRKPTHREIIALPGRGFFYRTPDGEVLLSPSALHTHRLLPIVSAVLFAASRDPMQRQDPTTVRARQQKIPVLAHLSFHVPGRGALDLPDLVKPGSETKVGTGLVIRALADIDERGRVPMTMGYQITDGHGFTLVAPALSARPEHVQLPDSADGRIDVLVLDPDHEMADDFVSKFRPRVTILEGFLDVRRWLDDSRPRSHRLDEVEPAIERFEKLGTHVLLLTPGQRFVLADSDD